MSQPPCRHIEAIILKITQDLLAIDDQLHALEVEGMNLLHPWAYVVLQRQVDRLNKKNRALQDAWSRAMNELAICRSSQPSPQDPRSSQPHWGSSARPPLQADGEGRPATHATALVQTAVRAWEEKDASALASYLSDDVICKHILPQPVGKAQLIAFMQAITTAFPDWSFNGHVLHEERLAEQSRNVLYVTAVTGTHMGDLILPTLPGIPATGKRIILFYGFIDAFFHALQLSCKQSTEMLLRRLDPSPYWQKKGGRRPAEAEAHEHSRPTAYDVSVRVEGDQA